LPYNLLFSSVRQHSSDSLEITVGNQHVDVQISLSLISFLGQDVARMRVPAFDLASGGNPKTFGRPFMSF
jgi:hypothetical protein